MRTLTAYNETETQKQQTEPFYLIEMFFTTIVRFCSLKTVTISSVLWSGTRTIKIPSLATNQTGTQSGALQLSDVDNLISGLVLTEGCAEKEINIYQGYGTPSDDTEIVRIFKGHMDSASIDDTSVTINLLGKNSTRFSPNIYMSPPDFNHMPPAGTIIKSGNVTVTLEKSS